MSQEIPEQELHDRLNLIEAMIAEGRRQTENWGWVFVLWGLVYYAALAWSAWGHNVWAWPVTIVIGIGVTMAIAWSKASHQPSTTLGRALGSIWIATGVSMFVLFFVLGASGRLADPRLFAALSCAMLGIANGASAILLRWKAQLACAVVWWAAVVGTSLGTETESLVIFLAAIFVCQIAFGIYGVMAHTRKNRIPAHA
jgi:hypothetical protein